MSKINCPQCGQKTLFSKKNPHRPFCCERCQLLDLGAWANEDFRIPTNEYNNISQKEKEESEGDNPEGFNPLLH